MNSLATSLIRTYVPIAVGAVAAYLLTLGLALDDETKLSLIAGLTALLQGLYYLAARILERKFPELSFLLGSAAQPTYKEKEPVNISDETVDNLLITGGDDEGVPNGEVYGTVSREKLPKKDTPSKRTRSKKTRKRTSKK